MKKNEWIRKQIIEAFADFPHSDPPFIASLLEFVDTHGNSLTRTQFWRHFNSLRPDDEKEYCDYMILDTQFSYSADFSEVWPEQKVKHLPKIICTAQVESGMTLPSGFIKIGGEPDWIQNDRYPICKSCDNDMVLFAQFCSLPPALVSNMKELDSYQFGDDGNLYLFCCPRCKNYEVDWQCA